MHPLLSDQLTAARDRLAPAVFDYYDAGSGDEVTREESVEAWEAYRLRPRVLQDVAAVDLSRTVLGTRLDNPVGVAPMAFHALAHPDAELATMQGASAAGSLLTLSTRASAVIEDVAAAGEAPWWFQVYVMRDRGVTRELVRRAAAAGAGALVLTGDTPYVGVKRRVAGVRIPLPDDHYLVNLGRHLTDGADASSALEQDPAVTYDVIAELAAASGLPVLVKGVLRGDDATRCLHEGAAGVVVSNHGGRQLDRSVPSAVALPEVVRAVGGAAPVLVDSGIRSGLDALVALALGADAVLVGRPVLWALASGGAPAVEQLLTTVRDDLAHAMALVGASCLDDLDPSLVAAATSPRRS
jgi:4-hydroxymandelate oxidase